MQEMHGGRSADVTSNETIVYHGYESFQTEHERMESFYCIQLAKHYTNGYLSKHLTSALYLRIARL